MAATRAIPTGGAVGSTTPASTRLRRRLKAWAAGLVVPLAALVLWTATARFEWLPPQILPAPDIVWSTLADMWASGDLLHHAAVSLLRVLEGFALGAAAGLLLGTAMGLSPTVEDYVRPLFTAVAQVPALGWVPLLMLVVGIDETLKILVIAMPVIIAVAFYVVWERKLIGWMHVRHGPMYVGMGIFQAFADVFKLLFKEVIQPAQASKFLYILAPLITMAPAFAAWAVVPFDAQAVLSNANVGLLYLLAMTSLGVYGVILAGWASNSKYAFLGAIRSASQVVSYEIAMGFALVGVMIAAGSLNMTDIVMAQAGNAGFLE